MHASIVYCIFFCVCLKSLMQLEMKEKGCKGDEMVENSFPKCPICKEEVLLPFSVSKDMSTKVYAHWVCTNCGFCIGTGDTRGYNTPKDILVGIFPEIVKRIEKIREEYQR